MSGRGMRPARTCIPPHSAQRLSVGTALPGLILYAGVEKPLFYALDIAVTNKCSEVCAEAIKKIAEAHFAGGASP